MARDSGLLDAVKRTLCLCRNANKGIHMPEYVITYNGGKKPESPEAGAESMGKWKAWIDGLGDAVVNPGTPLRMSRIVSSDGVSEDVGQNPLTGFTILKADNLDLVLDMAKACPFLEMGTLGVAEVMEMG